MAGSGTSLHYDQFIEQQLFKTRRRVKLVDLGSMLMGLIGGVIVYLLIVVIVDHWVLPLNRLGRWTALAVLLLGAGYYIAAHLVPLLLRHVNPAYAARAIEQSAPSLKNSLINFLMFRRDATATSRLVYQALRQKAALDLRQVNVDLAVDRTRLIHIGYVVVALMVLFAIYTIFSPKDVFTTVWRVSAPWADVDACTRVTIDDAIEPGDTEKIRGEHVTVTARIQGLAAEDTVTLYYTTKDKQIADRRAISMTRSDEIERFKCVLPADPSGIQQSLTYHIEAGDARSSDFTVKLLETPTILVDRIEYDYPAYTYPAYTTGRERPVVKPEGEIRAIEGTRVTIRARTNHPISGDPLTGARIHFDPDLAQGSPRGDTGSQRMETTGKTAMEASHSFTLRWNDKTDTPQHSSYRLSFTTAAGLPSEYTMVYQISVSRDLKPEIAILTPKDHDIEVPLNGTQRIEIRALDPDFGLSRIVLRTVAGGNELLNEELLNEPQNATGQVVVNYDFSPSKLGLAAGDRVTYWAFAEDNRHLPGDPPTNPNSERTVDYVITVLPPDPSASGNSAAAAQDQQADDSEHPQPGQDQPPPSATDQQQRDQTGSPKESPKSEPQDQDTPGKQDSGAQQEQEKQGQSNSSDQGGQGQSEQQQTGQSQSGQQGEQADQGQADKGEGQQQEGSQTGDAGSEMTPGSQGGSDGSSGQQKTAGSAGSSGNQAGEGANQSSQPTGSGGKPTGESQASDASPGRCPKRHRNRQPARCSRGTVA